MCQLQPLGRNRSKSSLWGWKSLLVVNGMSNMHKVLEEATSYEPLPNISQNLTAPIPQNEGNNPHRLACLKGAWT